MKLSFRVSVLASLIGVIFPATVLSAAPLIDRLAYQKQITEAYVDDKPLPMRATTALKALRCPPNGIATGGPVGLWSIENGKLWLMSLMTCNGTVPLTRVYPGQTDRMHADWLTGYVSLGRGKILCKYKHVELHEKTLKFRVVNGVVTDSIETDNSRNSGVPPKSAASTAIPQCLHAVFY